MNKPNKKDTLNLVFSAFLVLGYVICSYFFLTMSATVPKIEPYINALVFIVFGLILFYATRVGEGKQVMRFSLATLLVLDLPALYIVLAQIIRDLPLHDAIANLSADKLPYSPLFILAAVALGYGLPYTFFSGYEIAEATEEKEEELPCSCGCCECAQSEEDSHELLKAEEDAVSERKNYVLADENTEGALMVVDDEDEEFDSEKEIKLSEVSSSIEDIKVGSFVKVLSTEE